MLLFGTTTVQLYRAHNAFRLGEPSWDRSFPANIWASKWRRKSSAASVIRPQRRLRNVGWCREIDVVFPGLTAVGPTSSMPMSFKWCRFAVNISTKFSVSNSALDHQWTAYVVATSHKLRCVGAKNVYVVWRRVTDVATTLVPSQKHESVQFTSSHCQRNVIALHRKIYVLATEFTLCPVDVLWIA